MAPISAEICAEVLAYYEANPHERGSRSIAERLRQAHKGQSVIGHSKVSVCPCRPGVRWRRPAGRRQRTETEDKRRAWAEYLFDQGMECLWAGWRLEAWALVAAYTAFLAMYAWWGLRKDPEQLRERSQARQAENVKPWDKTIMAAYTVFLLLTPIVAGLDAGRFH